MYQFRKTVRKSKIFLILCWFDTCSISQLWAFFNFDYLFTVKFQFWLGLFQFLRYTFKSKRFNILEKEWIHINTLPHYLISHKTLYLEQSFDLHAETSIEETDANYTCLQPMTTILEQTCLSFGSTVAGRKKSMQKIFNLNQTPIFPISPHHDLYCFQTHSPRTDHCVFILTTHLTHYTACADGITFHFNSGKSKHVQMTKAKTEKIMSLFSLYTLYFKNALPMKQTHYVWQHVITMNIKTSRAVMFQHGLFLFF